MCYVLNVLLIMCYFFFLIVEIFRGCQQIDPVFQYLFNLCVEMFGFFIRQKKNIRCIKMRKENYAYYNLQMIQAKAIWICAKINCNTICSDTGLQWTTEPFAILSNC